MNPIKKFGLGLALASSILTAHAVPITGDIAFGSIAPVALTGGATFLTATGFDFAPGNNAIVNIGSTGSFSVLDLQLATFYDFGFAPLVGGNPVWTVTLGGWSFSLSSVSVTRTSTSITLDGIGTVSSTTPGLETNSGDFHFSVQGNDQQTATFSFSSDAHSPSSRVPDGGNTLVLLGASLIGMVGFARRFMARS